MNLLDCGCGVGSITLDLADIVAPGQVIGIDVDDGQLDVARESARQRQILNVSFQSASVYDLPFSDGTFDAALAHTLLMHLSDPLAALKEIRRVLKPGGVAGIVDDDFDTLTVSPANTHVEEALSLWTRFIEYSGGSPFYSRHLRSYLLDAGFARTRGHAVAADHFGTAEETRFAASVIAQLFHRPEFIDVVTEQGWADRATLQSIANALIEWGERPDAFLACMYCAAVGWVEKSQ